MKDELMYDLQTAWELYRYITNTMKSDAIYIMHIYTKWRDFNVWIVHGTTIHQTFPVYNSAKIREPEAKSDSRIRGNFRYFALYSSFHAVLPGIVAIQHQSAYDQHY